MPNLQPLKPIARRALSAQSDERLVRLTREGHDPAFEEIVRRYRGPLVGFAAAIVTAAGAEDVVQASLTKAHAALLEDSREINLRPWLFAIVRNAALNAIRGEPRVDVLDEALATHANPSDLAEQRDELDRLVVAMCALPDAQRQALVKRELEGVGHGEIAAQLGTTATAVRGLIFRARTQLRNAVGALVPLPLLRAMLTHGSATAAGAAGGMAGGGASAAMVGGAGAKGGALIVAVVVAVGSGIALERRHHDRGTVETAAAATSAGHPDPGWRGAGGPSPEPNSADTGPNASNAPTEARDPAGSSGSGQQSGGSGSPGSSGASASTGSSSGSGSGHGSSGAPPPVSGDDGGSEHSGHSNHEVEDVSPESEQEDSSGSSGPEDSEDDSSEDDSSSPDDSENSAGSEDRSGRVAAATAIS